MLKIINKAQWKEFEDYQNKKIEQILKKGKVKHKNKKLELIGNIQYQGTMQLLAFGRINNIVELKIRITLEQVEAGRLIQEIQENYEYQDAKITIEKVDNNAKD